MIIDHVDDPDRGHLFHIDPAVVLAGERVVIGFQNEAVWVDEIDGELLVPISSQVMPPIRWRRGHQGQGASRLQDGKADHDHLGHPRPVCLLEPAS